MDNSTKHNISIRSILDDLLGKPLRLDRTYVPTAHDPYGLMQAQDKNRKVTLVKEKPYSMESYETVNRQMKRLKEAEAQLIDLILAEVVGEDESHHQI